MCVVFVVVVVVVFEVLLFNVYYVGYCFCLTRSHVPTIFA